MREDRFTFNGNHMIKASRFSDILLVIGLVLGVSAASHFVITNPLAPTRLLYYLQAPFVQATTKCSPGAPDWMQEFQKFTVWKMAAHASQLVYITPEGQRYHCETGGKKGVFSDDPVEQETRFRFASLTKTVTAGAIIELSNSGKLSLSTPIVDLLRLDGQLNDPRVADVTIEHLLSHRGGWDRERGQDVMFMRNHQPWCPGDPARLKESVLMYDPGKKEVYSNLGYCLLGLAIEKVTGKSFRTYLSDHYNFDLSTLAFVDGPFLSDEVTYDFRFENFYDKNYYKYFNFYALSSSAGLSGSATDLANLVSRFIKTEPLSILDGDMYHSCTAAKIQSCYGYGLFRYQPDESDMPLYLHGGKLPGNPAVISVDPEGGVLIWLGAGGPRPGTDTTKEFYDYIRETLIDYYDWQAAP